MAKANLGKSGLLLLPHFIGSGTPYLDPQSRGALLGLKLSTEPEDIVAAILEGTTFELKINLESLEKAGVVVERMHAVGGGAKSDRWLQLKADITGKPIQRLELTEAGCLGAAVQAGMACGEFQDRNDVLRDLVKSSRQFKPNLKVNQSYSEMLDLYRHLYQKSQTLCTGLIKNKLIILY